MTSTVYAMITSKSSDYYTGLAIDSFLKHTKLGSNDQFYLIDNDAIGTHRDKPINIIVNSHPQSFSKNINDIIDLADDKDIVILNNDIVFTSGWSEPLKGYHDTILIPSCNQTHLYSSGNLVLEQSMNIDQYNNPYELNDIVRQHRSVSGSGFFEKLIMPFYAVKIPAKIYKTIGKFNETYGKGGGEDVDYRLRAIQAGFSVKYVKSSYLLHFQGKSTWSGAEAEQETLDRNQKYFDRFTELWGSDLSNLLLNGGIPRPVIDKYLLWSYIENNDFTGMIKQMLSVREGNSIVSLKNVSAYGLLTYIKELGDNLTGCELGVCKGFTLRHFLDLAPEITKVYAIDSWTPYMDWWGPVTQSMVDNWREYAMKLLNPYMNRIEILEMDATLAASYIPDQSLDYIFIDGDHSYEAVVRDLDNYWNKVRLGGIFSGHDWHLPAVNQAVNEFRHKNNITSEIRFTESNVWFWYK